MEGSCEPELPAPLDAILEGDDRIDLGLRTWKSAMKNTAAKEHAL